MQTFMFPFLFSVLLSLIAINHSFSAEATPSTHQETYRSIVKIEVSDLTPNYALPWSVGSFSSGTGTGFLIGENQIITNAHVVSNAQRVLINVHGISKKYPARVKHIAHDCDLALLELEDEADFRGFPIFKFGDVPSLESSVTVLGYPIGGKRISVTKGIVSRIDFNTYAHSRVDSHLTIQIDAAINPGNSGGPVLQNGQVIGIAFQGLSNANNTGYIIPTPVIKRFLQDVKDGVYDHYTELGFNFFPLFSPTLKAYLGIQPEDQGVLINTVTPQSSSYGILEPGDILMNIEGLPIDNSGMVLLNDEKVHLVELAERRFSGDIVQVRFIRNGSWLDASITLKPFPQAKMQSIAYEERPKYFVAAGLVFQPLNFNLYLAKKFDDFNIRKMYNDYISKGLFQKHQDVVVLTQVLDDKINSKLYDGAGFMVEKINNINITSLAQAYELFYQPNDSGFIKVELKGMDRPLIIKASELAAADQRIQDQYSISHLKQLN